MQQRRALPIVILVLGLVASLAAAWLLARTEEQRREARFEGATDAIVGAIESRMLAQLTLLRGAAGFFNASDEVTRDDFSAFVGRLRLERNYPGVLGIGYAAAAADHAALDRLLAGSGAPDGERLRPWPEREGSDRSAIVYLEPLNHLNRAALGFDMMSEPTRRTAMAAARQSGSAALSGRVQLVQEIEAVKQPGFLIYLPLYRGRTADGGELVSPESHYGWVYSPLRAHDMFDAVLGPEDLGGTIVEIYDHAAEEERLLYRTAAIGANPERLAERRITTAGRGWVVRVAPGEGFEGRSPLPLIVAIGGALISLLIAALMFQQIRGRARTEREVALRTAELTAANLRMHAEAKAREAAEAQVRQMQKMEAIGQLTGGIAHDFNNMLAVVIGNLDIVERRLGDTERVERAIRNARAGAEKAAVLTSRLLAFGRQQALSPRALDPNRLVAGMSELLRRTLGEKVRLETRLADGAWPVCADAPQLENAILNLAINGRDAMPGGGVLTIATANCADDDGEHVLIKVSDTGHGMAPEVIERAVDPFFTTKAVGRGTGLGLSQVYGFVTQSGGRLRLTSEVGAGTVAEIRLPRHAGPAPASEDGERPVAELPLARAGEKVLVVEDDEQVRELSAAGLRELGYQVLEAANGAEAVALLDAGAEADLLFTDMVMPEMGGDALAREARARRPGLKLLFTTGYSRDVVDGAVAGALLQKPFTLAELALGVRQELDRAG